MSRAANYSHNMSYCRRGSNRVARATKTTRRRRDPSITIDHQTSKFTTGSSDYQQTKGGDFLPLITNQVNLFIEEQKRDRNNHLVKKANEISDELNQIDLHRKRKRRKNQPAAKNFSSVLITNSRSSLMTSAHKDQSQNHCNKMGNQPLVTCRRFISGGLRVNVLLCVSLLIMVKIFCDNLAEEVNCTQLLTNKPSLTSEAGASFMLINDDEAQKKHPASSFGAPYSGSWWSEASNSPILRRRPPRSSLLLLPPELKLPVDNSSGGGQQQQPLISEDQMDGARTNQYHISELPTAQAQVSNVVGGGAKLIDLAPGGGGAIQEHGAGAGATGTGSGGNGAAVAHSLATQQAAYALAQEQHKANSRVNAELCQNFSVGYQDANGGVFTSPNYPNPYPVELICHRLIEAPVGHYIVLDFRDQFNIEEAGTECDNDKIEIRDGRYGYSKVLARYCGSKFPPEVRSTNEAMWLRFISDASITHNGFKAVYKFEKQKNIKPNPPFECRFNVTAMTTQQLRQDANGTLDANRTGIHSGVIRNTDVPEQLMNYTKNFNVSLECIWNITVMPGWKIYLTFSNYELNKPNDCDSNFIEIYEENLTEENQTVKFCGTRTEPQQSKSNVFNIRHHALPSAASSRFEIIYTAFRDKGIEGCDDMEFDCDDGTCIHNSLKCDGQVNCKYRYDEASDPGPCQADGPEGGGSFFETEHMVIILIVFLTLVGGMCASIIVSCWGKIQERRRRKLEYHMRKSREASMEGQLNKVDQMIYNSSNDRSAGGQTGQTGSGQLKQRYAAVAANSNSQMGDLQQQQQQQQQLMANHQQQQQQILAGDQSGYGMYDATGNQRRLMMMSSDQSLDHENMMSTNQKPLGGIFLNRSKVGQQQQQQVEYIPGPEVGQQQQVNNSLHNVQQSILASMKSQQGGGGSSNKLQQSVPDLLASRSLQQSLQSQEKLTSLSALEAQQQQMLNLSIQQQNRNQQIAQQQQRQKLLSSIYQQQNAMDNISNNSINNNNNNNNDMNNDIMNQNPYGRGRYSGLQQQQQLFATDGSAIPAAGGLLSQAATSAQTMPMSLAKYSSLLQAQLAQQQQAAGSQQPTGEQQAGANYDTSTGSQFNNHPTLNQQRALTLSTLHQGYGGQQRSLQAAYGQYPAAHHLSSSATCCNVLGADCNLSQEAPLISDLLARANLQQQQQQSRMQHPAAAGNRAYELRSATMGPAKVPAGIPRSISAHQLSRSQMRRSQSQAAQQQQQQQQRHPQQQQMHLQQAQQQQVQHHHQLPYKSISDAGHAVRHQPPNHSLSYPHACTGSHPSDGGGQQMGALRAVGQSPALPPPPPPPNLHSQPRSATACGSLGASKQQQQLPAAAIDSRRAAFKISRLDPSQLTGDTLQDPDMMVAQLPPMGSSSLQFDELESTESDATFGMLVGPGHLLGGHQQFGPSSQVKQPTGSSHLSDCNLIRRQRMLASGQLLQAQQQTFCDCGALDRALASSGGAGQVLAGSSREYDDSDDCLPPGPQGACYGDLISAGTGNSLLNGSNLNYGTGVRLAGGSRQQQYARFRHQSSEMTGDNDDDDDDEDDDEENVAGEELEEDDDATDGFRAIVDQDDELDSDRQPPNSIQIHAAGSVIRRQLAPGKSPARAVYGTATATTTTRPMVRNEALRDAPGRHLSGSHTSISCQSCTCGSQLRLDQLAVANASAANDEQLDESESKSSSLVQEQAGNKQKQQQQQHVSQIINQSSADNQQQQLILLQQAQQNSNMSQDSSSLYGAGNSSFSTQRQQPVGLGQNRSSEQPTSGGELCDTTSYRMEGSANGGNSLKATTSGG